MTDLWTRAMELCNSDYDFMLKHQRHVEHMSEFRTKLLQEAV